MAKNRKDNRGRVLPPNVSQKSDLRYIWRKMINGTQYVLTDNDLNELKKKIITKESQLQNGIYSDIPKATLNEWFEKWMDIYKSNLKLTTRELYTRYWNNYVRESNIGNMRIDRIKRVHIVELYKELLENKELATAKTQEIFERFKQEGGEAYDEAAIQAAYQLHLDDLAGLTGYENSLDCTNIGYDEYGAMLIEMPRKAEKSTTWNKAAIVIYNSMWAYKAYSKQTLTVAISIIKDVKLTEEQEEPKDYMLVFAEHPIGEDGGEGGGEDGGGIIVM